MKRIYLAMIMAATVMAMSARDRLYINDFSISTGESKTIEVLLSNDTTYCALQTDIVLPEGLTIDMDGNEYVIDLTSRKGRDHIVSSNLLANGAIRVLVTSQNSNPFNGNSGAILTIDITAAQSFAKGNIVLRNSVVVEEDGIPHSLAQAIAKVNGDDGIVGDVNGDDKVNVSDVTALVNMILGVIPKDMTRADVNGDGKINVSDVTALINIILGVI
ncbi:MAG: dockerin type I repeat-containing protein [Muribaculaceae bacterium]|nr:dockerin type I repeat-containing protein [Muribaculaceae bacterium]